jgi:hypothetical protein
MTLAEMDAVDEISGFYSHSETVFGTFFTFLKIFTFTAVAANSYSILEENLNLAFK